MIKNIDEKDIISLCEVWNNWCAEGCPVTEESQYAKEKRTYVALYRLAKTDSNEDARVLLETLEAKKTKPQLGDFDLKEHLSFVVEKYGNFTLWQIKEFDNLLKKSDIEVIDCEFAGGVYYCNQVNESKQKVYEEKAQAILNDIISVNKQPNKHLAEILKENPIIFRFDECESTDACVYDALINGKKRGVLCIASGLMSDDRKDLLAGIMCHELGHWLEISNRPVDFCGDSPLCAECFADIMGHQLCENTGYDFQVRVDNYTKFVKDLKSRLPKNDLAVMLGTKRLEFYKKMFIPEKQICYLKNLNKKRISYE